MTRICFPSGLKQASRIPILQEKLSPLSFNSNGPKIQCPVSESQTYKVVMPDDDNDVETKVFSSSNKTMHHIECLWYSATKIFFGHSEGLPSLMVRVFENLGQNF